MATFSSNQVRHFYVADAYSANQVTASSTVGTLSVGGNADAGVYLAYSGPGGLVRSDLINPAKIAYAKVTPASKMARKLRKDVVALDANINSGAPIVGQDYLLRIAFKQHIGLSTEDQYFKYGAVRVTPGMTAEQFYQTLVDSLEKNFSREVTPLLKFSVNGEKAAVTMTTNSGLTVTAKEVGTAGNSLKFAVDSITAAAAGVVVSTANGVTTITASLTGTAKTIGDLADLIAADSKAGALVEITGTAATAVAVEAAVALAGGSATGIVIEEIEQPWVLGKMESVPLFYSIQPDLVVKDGVEMIWGVVTAQTPTNTVANGKQIADLEYFAMGERADLYRGIGFPHNIETTYLVNPAKEYSVIDLGFYYSGDGEDVQKSQKVVTVAVPDGTTGSKYTVINAILGALETALGVILATDLAE